MSKDVGESGHMCNSMHLYQRSSKICLRELHNFLVANAIGLMEGFQILKTSKLERKINAIQESLSKRDMKTKS